MNVDSLIGIGLRHPHYKQILEELPVIGWVEVHSENFFARGGRVKEFILKVAQHYPISMHGVGLSLGSVDGISTEHLQRLSLLIQHIKPCFVSEHLSWSSVNGLYMPDLLPIPYTEESLGIFKNNVLKVQDFLKQELLIENPSSYIEYQSSQKDEVDFLVEICNQTGAKILLDVNNVFVSSWNHGWQAKDYIDAIPQELVKEIHIAGHTTKELPNKELIRIDTHNQSVCHEVWDLYGYAIARFGCIPTLLEWDADIPPFDDLLQEAKKCHAFFDAYHANGNHDA